MDTTPQRLAMVATTTNDDDMIRVLGSSLYPGARAESIRLVLEWCRATGRDPMKKPIHIVPMKVKDQATNRWEWRDVLMPGIGTYRTDAATTGQYAGLDEPEFGPDKREDVDGCELTFPTWCRVTVYRMVGSERCPFTAKEYWIENYSSGEGGRGVNAMWRKRPFGQLAKVVEAQALRKAFPDETGHTYTHEEMDGRSFQGETIEAEVENKRGMHRTVRSERYQEEAVSSTEAGSDAERVSAFMTQTDNDLRAAKNGSEAHKILIEAYAKAPKLADLAALEGHPFRKHVRDTFPKALKEWVDEAEAAASARLVGGAPADTNGNALTNGNGSPDLAGNGSSTGHGEATPETPPAQGDKPGDGWPGPQ